MRDCSVVDALVVRMKSLVGSGGSVSRWWSVRTRKDAGEKGFSGAAAGLTAGLLNHQNGTGLGLWVSSEIVRKRRIE